MKRHFREDEDEGTGSGRTPKYAGDGQPKAPADGRHQHLVWEEKYE